ncbi:MAG: right-handed parallel beta-helix repeat-containing protein [Tepidisphaerales bacterium]
MFNPLCLLLITPFALAADTAQPIGEPVLDPPTLRSLGVYWVISGDDNKNARVSVDWRKRGAEWHAGWPLLRVEKGRHLGENGESLIDVPAGAWLFAGSVILLDPDTAYEIRLKLTDPDGGSAERVLKARTLAEPVAPAGGPTFHVTPGDGGGDGSAANPFKGLAAAQKSAKPGDTFLLHAGAYESCFTVNRSGEPGRPIVWRSAGDGEPILDGRFEKNKEGYPTGHVVDAIGVHDVWFEGLSIRNGWSAIRTHESQRLVIRRCHITGCIGGVFGSTNDTAKLAGFFITDNLMEGMMPWPATKKQWDELPESRGVWLTGTGHVIAYNRVHHFKDGIDVSPSQRCDSTDIHNNDISQVFDDGSELDGSYRNVRFFHNRITDCLCGISFQPIYGGPAYAFRNVVYNIRNEPLKLHNSPSGAVIFHNTFVKKGPPLLVSTSAPVSNCWTRNNLFIGTTGRAVNFDCPMIGCDFDYDGFGGFNPAPDEPFVKFNRRYASADEIHRKGDVYGHLVLLDPAKVFRSGLRAPDDELAIHDGAKLDFTLSRQGEAIDAGEVPSGLNDGFSGKAPDLGALESGAAAPHYGPRPAADHR